MTFWGNIIRGTYFRRNGTNRSQYLLKKKLIFCVVLSCLVMIIYFFVISFFHIRLTECHYLSTLLYLTTVYWLIIIFHLIKIKSIRDLRFFSYPLPSLKNRPMFIKLHWFIDLKYFVHTLNWIKYSFLYTVFLIWPYVVRGLLNSVFIKICVYFYPWRLLFIHYFLTLKIFIQVNLW